MDLMARAHIFISGNVQKVWFRETIRQRADRLGLKGWVKNLNDGRLEVIFEGEKNKVDEVINAARKGPILSEVTDVDVVWEKYKNEFNSFDII